MYFQGEIISSEFNLKVLFFYFKEELSALEGLKCKVPFKYEWGGLGYHNAIVIGSELGEEDLVYVKTVFMHPTTKKMQPCPYFLEGNCKYSDEKCHYSHGHIVRLDEVQDFKYETVVCTMLLDSVKPHYFFTVTQITAKLLKVVQCWPSTKMNCGTEVLLKTLLKRRSFLSNSYTVMTYCYSTFILSIPLVS